MIIAYFVDDVLGETKRQDEFDVTIILGKQTKAKYGIKYILRYKIPNTPTMREYTFYTTEKKVEISDLEFAVEQLEIALSMQLRKIGFSFKRNPEKENQASIHICRTQPANPSCPIV